MISVVMAPILLHAASQELSLSTDASWPAFGRLLRPESVFCNSWPESF